jgi:ribosome biogenesis GTPase A
VQALDEPFLVAVVGEFNSGKSSVINALLGRWANSMGDADYLGVVCMLCGISKTAVDQRTAGQVG